MSQSQWFVFPRPVPHPSMRLFCFPYAGGSTTVFRPWADELPVSVEVGIVRLPGRESRLREAPFTQMRPLVEALTDALIPYLDRPFAFFGHSLGAIISYEVAHHLARHYGAGPNRLIVSGHAAPQRPRVQDHAHELPAEEFKDHLRRLNGTPQAVLDSPELMTLFEPILRADFALSETYVYRPRPPLDCPITVIGGSDDPQVHPDDLHGWFDQTRDEFSLFMLPGDHFFIHSANRDLLAILTEDLQSLAETPPRVRCG